MDLDELREQTKNARTMPAEMFDRLTENIRTSGRLESLPFCALGSDDVLRLISGHHRTRCARAAELKQVLCLVDVAGLSRSEVVSKQLSHNAISGTDNDEILGELFAEIDNLEDMIRSAIDPESLVSNDKYSGVGLDAVKLVASMHTITLQFFDTQKDDIETFIRCVSPDASEAWLLPKEIFEKYQKVLAGINDKLNIKSPSAAFARLIEIGLDYLEVVEHAPRGKGDAKSKEPKQAKEQADKPKRPAPKHGTPHHAALEALRRAKEKQAESVLAHAPGLENTGKTDGKPAKPSRTAKRTANK